MAFLKYARSSIVKPDILIPGWEKICKASNDGPNLFTNREASKIAIAEFQPKDYMLSHATIVASVDVEDGPGKIGKHVENGFQIDRRWKDYYITPETSQFINSNLDSWTRPLLLATYRTFIGSDNFLEHLQLPEMSKGKIIDAVARDIGPSVYIDILVATHRKHRSLIAAINREELNALSMGCVIAFSQCTKCGNVAKDESELCAHIRFSKGAKFFDDLGNQRVVAELCGHSSDPTSCKFIEASWVKNPAFKGAVLRNILTKEEEAMYHTANGSDFQTAMRVPTSSLDAFLMSKAARAQMSGIRVPLSSPKKPRTDITAFDFGSDSEDEFPDAGSGSDKSEDTKSSPLDKAVDELTTYMRDQAVKRLKKDLSPEKSDSPQGVNLDDTLKQASTDPRWRKVALATFKTLKGDIPAAKKVLAGMILHQVGGWQKVASSNRYSGGELLTLSRFLDTLHGVSKVAGEHKIYRTVQAVGGYSVYGDDTSYLAACGRVLGHTPNATERAMLLTKGRLFDLGR